jgi:ATP-dependent DNA helicase RecG
MGRPLDVCGNMPVMAIEQVPVGVDEVAKLLSFEEGHFLELKGRAVSPAKLSKALSAFSNADGGDLYVGVEENGTGKPRAWRGFVDMEAANGHLQALEALFPLGDGYLYEFLSAEHQAGYLLHIAVQKSRDVKVAQDGTAYLRRGAQSLPQTTDEQMARLKRTKGLTTFETESVAAPLDIVANSEVIIGFLLEVVPTGEPLPWLRKQLLIHHDQPTVGCVLLFADEPQAALPKRSAIKIYRYTTTDPDGSRDTLAFDPITIEGCLYSQIYEALERTVNIIEDVRVLTPEGLKPITYPIETLHEIITNAVLHRDYAVADDVHVRVFDNRVEVESPGRLPGHVSPKNILDERFSRNGAIVRMINKFPNPPNKDVGEGLNTAFAAMKKLQLKDPEILELDNSVLVNIRHERLGSPEELIMTYLEDHDEINNRTVRALTGIGSENKVKTIFQGLMKAGAIERVPNKGGGSACYRKASTTSTP